MKSHQVRVKSNHKIIVENQDYHLFNKPILKVVDNGEQFENRLRDARYSLYDDIAKKFNISRKLISHKLGTYDISFIRELAVFGEHEYLIDEIKARINGSF